MLRLRSNACWFRRLIDTCSSFFTYHFDQNDVLLTELEADCKKNLSVFAYKNLQELIAQLKTFYEEYWVQSIEKQVVRLNEGCSFEQSLLILSICPIFK